MKNIGWQLHKYSDGTKTCGGSFGGDISMETANRLVKVFLDVEVLPSGYTVFIDKKTGERVTLSFSIDASKTDKGKEALKEYRKKKQAEEQKEEERRERINKTLSDYNLEQLEALLNLKEDTGHEG